MTKILGFRETVLNLGNKEDRALLSDEHMEIYNRCLFSNHSPILTFYDEEDDVYYKQHISIWCKKCGKHFCIDCGTTSEGISEYQKYKTLIDRNGLDRDNYLYDMFHLLDGSCYGNEATKLQFHDK